MSLRPRPNTFSHYRLFFAITFLCLGMAALALVAMDTWRNTGLFLLFGDDAGAVLKSVAIAGGLSLVYALVMFELITDRRAITADRRRCAVAVDFAERRSGTERRDTRQASGEKSDSGIASGVLG